MLRAFNYTFTSHDATSEKTTNQLLLVDVKEKGKKKNNKKRRKCKMRK